MSGTCAKLTDVFLEEDIILDGTPLHDYLKNLETNNNWDIKDEDSIETGPCIKSFLYGINLKDFLFAKWVSLRLKLSSLFPLSQDVLVKMSKSYYTQYGNEILKSSVIIEDDLDYLCLQNPQQFLTAIHHSTSHTKHNLKTRKSARYLAVFIAILACFVSLWTSPYLPSAGQLVVLICASFVLFFNVRLEIVVEMWKRQHEMNLVALKCLLSTSSRLHKLIRNSIRLIQEIEVVSRGYKLINGKTPIVRIEQNNTNARAFYKLRVAVFSAIVRCFISCREATLKMQKFKVPSDLGEENERDFLCNIPLDELGSFFVEKTSGAIHIATDGYSLSVLKHTNELLCKQRSELVTCMSLALSGTTWDFSGEGFLSNVGPILSEVSRTNNNCRHSLQCSYDMHKYLTSSGQPRPNAECAAGKSKTSVLSMNLHSLQVHLRAAMHATMKLENDVTQDRDLGEVPLETIMMHLRSGSECLDQCDKQLDLLRSKPVSDDDEVEVSDWSNVPHVTDVNTVNVESVSIANDDTYEEDKIFEATTDGQESNSSHCNVSSNHPDENARQIAEESATVIRELRSVLAVKTSLQEREKWKQKLFPNYIPKSPPAPGTREDEINNGMGNVKIASNGKIATAENHFSSITDDPSEPKLTFPRRAAPPGRPPSARHRKLRIETPTEQIDTIHQNNHVNPTDSVKNVPDVEPEWTNGIGIGFSNVMAAQAAQMAKQRSVLGHNVLNVALEVEAETYGSDDDLSS